METAASLPSLPRLPRPPSPAPRCSRRYKAVAEADASISVLLQTATEVVTIIFQKRAAAEEEEAPGASL